VGGPEKGIEPGTTGEAFRWVVDLLDRTAIPYLIVGGLAARAYGSTRALADIDMYIPGDRFTDLVAEISEYVTFGPERVVTEHWDIVFVAMEFAGQRFEFGDADKCKIFDSTRRLWIEQDIDLSKFELMELFGSAVHVMKRERLIEYKNLLGRDVDLKDIAQISHG
jgi:hypothetical protein